MYTTKTPKFEFLSKVICLYIPQSQVLNKCGNKKNGMALYEQQEYIKLDFEVEWSIVFQLNALALCLRQKLFQSISHNC